MKQIKKKRIIILSILMCMCLLMSIYFFERNNSEYKEAEKVSNRYLNLLSNMNYTELTELFSKESLTKDSTSKEKVVERFKNIFSGIDTQSIVVKDVSINKKEKKFELKYFLEIKTEYGIINTKEYVAVLEKKNVDYKIYWKSELLFPEMSKNDRVRVTNDNVRRGKILDRNGKELAINYDYQQLGINPSKFQDEQQKQLSLNILEEKFNVPKDIVNRKLSQSWAVGDVYVPIKTLEKSINHMDIMELPKGLVMGSINLRHYPLGEASAHLIGYVSKVNEEDLKKNLNLSEEDYIGRTGLEATFDKELRGQNGVEINIIDENNKVKKNLLNKKKIVPKDLILTIDSEAQKIAFDSLGGTPSSSVVSDPKNGELLVATGSPSYNPNKMVLGITEEDYNKYSEDKNLPFMVRFANRYAPGSTFKTITAAIGLDSGDISTDEIRSIEGLKWQKDGSWGGFWTTRVKEVSQVDLKRALVYSDNIFFAQKSLEMGENVFRAGLSKFIFDETIDIPIYMENATISNANKFQSEILLADTAYGQGELMISPISQLTMYSIFMNNGNLIYPKIIKNNEIKSKNNIVSEQSADIVLNDLIDTVASQDGYAYSLYRENFILAAKTGTAEIKEKQDTLGTENSFLLYFDVRNRRFMGLTMSEDSRRNGIAVDKSLAIVDYLETQYQ